MAKDFIVAIELGSSKMTGIAGRKNPDGSITVLAVASEDSTSYIRKGVVYNIDKTAQGLSNIPQLRERLIGIMHDGFIYPRHRHLPEHIVLRDILA